MRKWHRWLSVFFAVFLLWIAATGVLSQLGAWQGELASPSPAAIAAATPPPGWECPEGWRCRPPQGDASGLAGMVGLFHHLHSGESFGPVGEVISLLSGFALMFFAFSGLWLYIRMWRERARRKARDRWFWK
ncbi:PepSY domain-containing protein [Altererythrobacter sp. N1]|uniref:PepSY domain-containing protein n=1 Tax=Tsuneonella suprasediminis TaxID=2306996 RepID=A0A419R5Q3_9SPHN|nr:PepSY domain-containing protein [Tsuneonella suprasediminis]UBS34494.1 PepSY domain-containing protein [Altererythrobacter sp. N1]